MVALDVTDCPCRLTVSRRATGVAFVSKTGTLHGNDGNLNERAAPGYEFVHERVSLMGKDKSGDLFAAKDISISLNSQMRSMQLITVHDRSWVPWVLLHLTRWLAGFNLYWIGNLERLSKTVLQFM